MFPDGFVFPSILTTLSRAFHYAPLTFSQTGGILSIAHKTLLQTCTKFKYIGLTSVSSISLSDIHFPNYSQLEEFHFNNNVDMVLKEFPQTIQLPTSLKVLSLGGFVGKLPTFSENIEELILSGNYFTGTLPILPKNIKNVGLGAYGDFQNQLSGILPPFTQTTLTFLDLGYNNFDNQIIPSFSSCTKLKTLFLNDNRFSGSIPNNLPNSLDYINFDNNLLSGTIPSMPSTISEFHARGNALECDGITSNVCATFNAFNDKTYNSLSKVSISNNQFHFPNGFEFNTKLKSLVTNNFEFNYESCTSCGTNMDVIGCTGSNAGVCQCKNGYYLENGVCTECPAGSFCPSPTDTSPTPCIARSYSILTKMTMPSSCLSCRSCTDINADRIGCGGSNEGTCQCKSGYYSNNGVCTECPIGSSCPSPMATTPTLCIGNTYTTQTKQTSCLTCSSCTDINAERIGCGGSSVGTCQCKNGYHISSTQSDTCVEYNSPPPISPPPISPPPISPPPISPPPISPPPISPPPISPPPISPPPISPPPISPPPISPPPISPPPISPPPISPPPISPPPIVIQTPICELSKTFLKDNTCVSCTICKATEFVSSACTLISDTICLKLYDTTYVDTTKPTQVAATFVIVASSIENLNKDVLACTIARTLGVQCSDVTITGITMRGKRRSLLQITSAYTVDFIVKTQSGVKAQEISTTIQSATFQQALVTEMQKTAPSVQSMSITSMRIQNVVQTTSNRTILLVVIVLGSQCVFGLVSFLVIKNKTKMK
jgi:hypothetical protein